MGNNARSAWRRRLAKAAGTKKAWNFRCGEIRTQILVSAGLWPEFERPPLKNEVFGAIERNGYSIEKVRLETWPGFWLTGNLYRPLAPGRHPGVACPHGHCKEGRFNDTEIMSVPGRAIGLTKLGCVVFTYDMVGYGDLKQIPHEFSDVPWGLSLLGLQLWDSLRAVDFLSELPCVDKARLGVTGASGGGTQTFLLAAVDPRITCAAPVNMVAAGCQGGCSCENAPLLRIDLNNVEIAAAVAPRPLILPSCSGDWTADTPRLEGPAIAKVYRSLGVPRRFRWTRTDAEHNYNREAREYVYAWFAHWLCREPLADRRTEEPFQVEPRENLQIYTPGLPPGRGLVGADELKTALKERIRAQMDSLWPRDEAGLARFRELMLPALRHTLSARWPQKKEITKKPGGKEYRLLPGPIRLEKRGKAAILDVFIEGDPAPRNARGWVLFLGRHEPEAPCNDGEIIRNPEWIQWQRNFPHTYHRTELARQVQDILTAASAVSGGKLAISGMGRAGVPVLLARALMPEGKIGRTCADLCGINDRSEETWTGIRLQPGILRVGGLRTAAILCAPGELLLRGASRFDTGIVRDAYRALGRERAFQVEP